MASNAANVFEYMTLIGKLKRVRRTGWVLRGVANPESVSDHMYRVAMTAVLAPPPLNADKCVKMALVHDMAECIVGDLTPHDNVSKEEKHRREEEATRHMCSLVGEPLGSDLYSLWQEYENQESEESKFVKDLDRLDMVVQAFEYEQQEQRPGFLQEFFDSTEGKFHTQTVREWHQHLNSLRQPSLLRKQSSQPANQNSADSSTHAAANQNSCALAANQALSSVNEVSVVADATDCGNEKRNYESGVCEARKKKMMTDLESEPSASSENGEACDIQHGRTGSETLSN